MIQTSAFYNVQLQIINLISLQYNVPLMCGPSVTGETLVLLHTLVAKTAR